MSKTPMSKKILIILFLVALFPRLYQLDQTTIYPDEITWMVRGKESVSALKQFNFNYFQTAWWHRPQVPEAIALPLVLLSGSFMAILGQGQSSISLNLVNEVVAARLPVALLGSLLIPIWYLFARKFLTPNVSFLTAVLLSLDPIHLSLSRWVMSDGLLTLFTFSSVYFFFFSRQKILLLLLASGCLAAAFLTKPTGLLPVFSWVTFSLIQKTYKKFFIALILLLLMVWLFWLGSWHQPLIAIINYLKLQTSLTTNGYNVLFFGQVTSNPPFIYYLPQITWRLPSIIIIILLTSLLAAALHLFKSFKGKDVFSLIKLSPYFIFPVLYFLIVSSASLKLGARYILPLWPWIYLAAGWGLSLILKRSPYLLFKTLVVAILISNSLYTYFTYLPDFYLFYNSLLGGPVSAQNNDLVGHCIGTKEALKYIQSSFPENKSVAILGCSNVTAPYYYHGQITTDWKKEKIVVIENTYNQLLPQSEEIKYFQAISPIYEVKVNGLTLSRVYKKN